MKRGVVLLVVAVLFIGGCGGGAGALVSYLFNVAGRITDATLPPAAISGASVTVSAGSTVLGTATTNASGDYTLSSLSTSASSVTWAVSAATYRTFSTSLTVPSGGTVTVNYAMARQVGSVSGTIAAAPTAAAASRTGSPGPAETGVRSIRSLPVYVPDRLVVKFRTNVQAAAVQALHQTAGAQPHKYLARLNVQVVRLNPGISALSAITAYRTSGLVEYVEQDAYAYALATPNDQYYSSQWHYPAINLPTAWDTTTGSAGVIVAVVDSGIRSHPDLDGVTVQGRDTFSDDDDPTDPGCSLTPGISSHGAHVTGTIAALTNNSIGVAGVNWGGAAGTRIMPVRVLGEMGGVCGTGTFSDIADGITYAADHGAKVINLSLGGSAASTTLENAVNYAYNRGVTLVAAAGNENGPVLYPAAYTNIIAVAATACNNAKAAYSNFGSQIDVAAPGGDSTVTCGGNPDTNWVWSPSWSANSGNNYYGKQGTSMATPHVAGVVALMISRGITGPANLQTTVQNTATDLGAPGRDDVFGYGLINAASAVSGGTSASRLRAFSGDLSGSTLTIRSDTVQVASSGSFTITNAHAGTRTVFAWQDFNGDGVLNAGDYFGQTNGVVINDGTTTSGVAVTVSYYSSSSITPQSVLTIRRSP